jgi:hypothetical protein
MRRYAERLRPVARRRTAVVIACFALITAPPTLAHWSYIDQYATGVNGATGTFLTPGYGHRHLNRVWHSAGRTWCVWYRLTNGNQVANTCDTNNPTGGWVENAYAKAACHNSNDISGVQWTCETTVTG